MKNVTINESISFESTLGSPSKPRPNNIVQKPKKIFLVNFVDDNISLTPSKKTSVSSKEENLLNKKSSKSKKTVNQKSISIKNNRNKEIHLLDFDAIIKNIIIGKKKSLAKYSGKHNNLEKNKDKKKLIGSKRTRIHSYKNIANKSKLIYLFL
jgi:hypothetical protein